MKLWMKIVIGIAIVFFVLMILGSGGEDKETDLSGIDTSTDVETSDTQTPVEQPIPSTGNELEDLQQQLNYLQVKISELEAEDLGGFEE